MTFPIDAHGKKIVWNFTLLNNYARTCPHQAMRRYFKRDIPFKETVEMKWGTEVHSAMEATVKTGKPLPSKMMQWEPFAAALNGRDALCELKLAIRETGESCDFFDVRAWFRGKVDVVIVGDSAGYILDWKTGNPKYEDAFELRTSALLVRARWPHLKMIVGQYAWLRENRLGQPHDLSDVQATRKEVQEIVRSVRESHEGKQWEKRKGPLCGWCPVSDCEYNKRVA